MTEFNNHVIRGRIIVDTSDLKLYEHAARLGRTGKYIRILGEKWFVKSTKIDGGSRVTIIMETLEEPQF